MFQMFTTLAALVLFVSNAALAAVAGVEVKEPLGVHAGLARDSQ